MGSKVSCSIVLAPTGKPFYWAGEAVSGHVVLTTNKSLKIKSADVMMFGRFIHTTPGTGKSSPHTITLNFFCQKHSLLITPTNGISYDEDGYYLEPNTYQWPFSMRLAKDLPPSLANIGQSRPYIKYGLTVNLGRPRFRSKIHSLIFINVTPHVSRPHDVWPVEREESNFRDLHIYGKLLRNYLLIGEPYISLELNIQNPSHTTIKEVTVTLIQVRRLAGKSGQVVIFKHSLPDIVDFEDDHLHHTFQVPVVPTFEFFAPTTYYKPPNKPGQIWVVKYVLEVKFTTRLFFTHVTLDFPLMVANSKRSTGTTALQ